MKAGLPSTILPPFLKAKVLCIITVHKFKLLCIFTFIIDLYYYSAEIFSSVVSHNLFTPFTLLFGADVNLYILTWLILSLPYGILKLE